MAKEYVAYGQLGGYEPGDVVNPMDWDEETWAYMVDHEVVVPKNSPSDPKVLEEQAQQAAAEAAQPQTSLLDQDTGTQSPKVQAGMEARKAANEPKTEGSSEAKNVSNTGSQTETKSGGTPQANKPNPLATPAKAPEPKKE
jgi:hypothetical protein